MAYMAHIEGFRQQAAEMTAPPVPCDTSRERAFSLLGRMQKTRMGRDMLQDAGAAGVCVGFDAQSPAMGIAFDHPKCIFLQPSLSDDLLATVLVHEIHHTLQYHGAHRRIAPQDVLLHEILISRLHEGDAFTAQTVYSLQAIIEEDDRGPFEALRADLARRTNAGEIMNFDDLCQGYLAATGPSAKEDCTEKIYDFMQKNVLHDYDAQILRDAGLRTQRAGLAYRFNNAASANVTKIALGMMAVDLAPRVMRDGVMTHYHSQLGTPLIERILSLMPESTLRAIENSRNHTKDLAENLVPLRSEPYAQRRL